MHGTSLGVVAVHELVERVVVDASQMSRHVRLWHLVEVVTAQQLVLARTAVIHLARLHSLVTQPVNAVQCMHHGSNDLLQGTAPGIRDMSWKSRGFNEKSEKVREMYGSWKIALLKLQQFRVVFACT